MGDVQNRSREQSSLPGGKLAALSGSAYRCASLLPAARLTCSTWDALTAPRAACNCVRGGDESEQWMGAGGDKGSEESGILLFKGLPNGLMSELHCWEIVRFVLSQLLGTSWFCLQTSGSQHNS